MTTWRYASSTDVGLVRQLNEDSISVDGHLAVVADGMGGHAAGEIASDIAIQEMTSIFTESSAPDELARAIDEANKAIMADADANPSHLGMGTTVVALGLATTEDGLLPVVVNVGDSRAYQLRDGAMRQVTADHSVAEEWVRQGRLTPEEAAVHPRRHQLTRTLGIEPGVRPDAFPIAAHPGDRVLLCSDGLSNELSDDEIAAIASAPRPLDEAVATLVAEANRHGGRDNISVILIEFDEVTAQPGTDAFELADPLAVARANSLGSKKQSPRRRRKKVRRVTWRSGAFLALLLFSFVLVYIVLDWFATSSYYLAEYSSPPGTTAYIAVYQGQPGGLLWFKPKLIVETPYPVNHLTKYDKRRVRDTISEPTSDAAISYAKFLNHEWRIANPTAKLNGAGY